MFSKLLFQIIAGIIGLFIAVKVVPGIEFTGFINTLIITGAILGLVNFFIKPILKLIALPIRIITFGLFSLVINMILIWIVVDVFSPIEIKGLVSLFWTTIIIWLLNLVFEIYISRQRKLKDKD